MRECGLQLYFYGMFPNSTWLIHILWNLNSRGFPLCNRSTWYNYMVSGSQNVACFSNRGEFILSVFSKYVVLWSLFLTLWNPATNYFVFSISSCKTVLLVSHALQDLSRISIDILLHLASTFCTTIVWPMYRSRGCSLDPTFPFIRSYLKKCRA